MIAILKHKGSIEILLVINLTLIALVTAWFMKETQRRLVIAHSLKTFHFANEEKSNELIKKFALIANTDQTGIVCSQDLTNEKQICADFGASRNLKDIHISNFIAEPTVCEINLNLRHPSLRRNSGRLCELNTLTLKHSSSFLGDLKADLINSTDSVSDKILVTTGTLQIEELVIDKTLSIISLGDISIKIVSNSIQADSTPRLLLIAPRGKIELKSQSKNILIEGLARSILTNYGIVINEWSTIHSEYKEPFLMLGKFSKSPL